MTVWEYHVTRDETQLTALGQQGWELVAALPAPTGAPVLYLKRPAQSFRERVTAEQKQRYYAGRDARPQGAERS